MIDWTFRDDRTGQRLTTWQSQDILEAYEEAARKAQRLANKHQTTVAYTAFMQDREGATGYRYPRRQGRPAKANALTNAERQAAYRQKRRAEGICPCCGQQKP